MVEAAVKRVCHAGVFIALVIGGSPELDAQSRFSQFKDPDDGAFDMSAWLATAHGFLPTVSLITEPAVGPGVALGAAFFHRPADWTIEGARAAFEARERQVVPSISVVTGGITANDSWFAGGGHLGVWRADTWRYTGFGGYGSFNLTVAGQGPLTGQERLFDYNIEGWAVLQGLRRRVARSDWWVGLHYRLLGMTAAFTVDRLPELDPVELKSRTGGLGLSVRFDNRNSPFTPDRGIVAALQANRQSEALGGSFDYGSATGSFVGYWDPVRELVLGLRVEGAWAGEDAPFWDLPSVSLRGINAGRYVGERAGAVETEVRWDIVPRWSAVAFGGGGWIVNAPGADSEARWVGGGGGGFRYLLARAFGMRAGTDLAYGTDGWAFYITMGSAWGRM